MGHNSLEEEAHVDNFGCSDEALDFWDMDLSGSFALELGNLGEDFDMVELELDTQEGVLDSSTAC